MCFRPAVASRKFVKCPNCQKMSAPPLSMDSMIMEFMKNDQAKAILEKHCAVMINDPQFKMAMRMTLKQVIPQSKGKITQEIVDLVEKDLAQLPIKNECKFCGASLS